MRESERDVEIRSGGSSFHLRVLPAEDFPKFPAEGEQPLTIPAAAMAETVEVVARAASRDDMRPVLTGVLVSASGEEMTMVATDSYRLAVKTTKLEPGIGGELEANIPARALRELGRIVAADGVEEVAVSLLPNQAVFRAGAIVLNTRLIDGQFPNFRQLLPESYEHDVRLPRQEFLEVTRRVSQLAQRNAPLRLSFAPSELTVAASTPDVGDAEETMPAAFEGEPLEIGFNPEFLKEGIESVEGDEVMLRRDLAAAARAAAAGRQRRLPLPGDADSPQRLDGHLRRRAGRRSRGSTAAQPRPACGSSSTTGSSA